MMFFWLLLYLCVDLLVLGWRLVVCFGLLWCADVLGFVLNGFLPVVVDVRVLFVVFGVFWFGDGGYGGFVRLLWSG